MRDAYVYAGCRQAKDILMPLADFISHIALNSNRDLFQSTLSVEQGGMNEVLLIFIVLPEIRNFADGRKVQSYQCYLSDC